MFQSSGCSSLSVVPAFKSFRLSSDLCHLLSIPVISSLIQKNKSITGAANSLQHIPYSLEHPLLIKNRNGNMFFQYSDHRKKEKKIHHHGPRPISIISSPLQTYYFLISLYLYSQRFGKKVATKNIIQKISYLSFTLEPER